MKKPSKNGSGGNGKDFSLEQLNAALRALDDLMDRCVTQNVYVLTDMTAHSVKNQGGLFGDGIDACIKTKYLTKEVVDTIKEYSNATFTEKGFYFEFEGVPIRVKYVTKNFSFLEHPEMMIYDFEDYQVPNPFDVYWRGRTLIR